MTTTLDPTMVDRYEERIRSAYTRLLAQLGRQPGDWMTLADLRPEVGGYRDYVDAALRKMGAGGYTGPDGSTTYLVPESNQKTLTDADREAALWMGNQWQHLIAIEY